MNTTRRTLTAITILAIGGLTMQATQAEITADTPQTPRETLLELTIEAERQHMDQFADSFVKELDQLLADSVNSTRRVRLTVGQDTAFDRYLPSAHNATPVNEMIGVLGSEAGTFRLTDPQLIELDDTTGTQTLPQADRGVFDLTRSPGAANTHSEAVMSHSRPAPNARLLVIALRG
jgi:hypothetical protein